MTLIKCVADSETAFCRKFNGKRVTCERDICIVFECNLCRSLLIVDKTDGTAADKNNRARAAELCAGDGDSVVVTDIFAARVSYAARSVCAAVVKIDSERCNVRHGCKAGDGNICGNRQLCCFTVGRNIDSHAVGARARERVVGITVVVVHADNAKSRAALCRCDGEVFVRLARDNQRGA